MSLVQEIKRAASNSIQELFNLIINSEDIPVNETNSEFEGDYTIILFTLLKHLRKSPEALGKEIGDHLVTKYQNLFSGYNVIKGFLNLVVDDCFFTDFLQKGMPSVHSAAFSSNQRIIVEYSSPNTNKPLHLGHLRNNFLGWSIAEILKATGNKVYKTCIVNDRGIHICKSIIAWQLYGKGQTPESTGIKGDHFVGDYYVLFETQLKKESRLLSEKVLQGDFSDIHEKDRQKLTEILELMTAIIGDTDRDKEKLKKLRDDRNEIIRAATPIMKKAQQMLQAWEKGETEVIDIWQKMNAWVYNGFDITYKKIGSDFDKVYYESETYILGRKYVEEGLNKGVFYKKDDGSVWVDLASEGLDEKLLLRNDGTSVYITQDLGLADEKYSEFNYDQSIYVIGDEQNYHMKILQIILKKLGKPYAEGICHLSYGMVELPGGRMKSREGTVVDADDLLDEMEGIAEKHTRDLGKVGDFDESDLKELYNIIGTGALKFYLLRVDPKKRMVFNPEESIDFHGFTGPFIQYTHARIKSILRKESPVPLKEGLPDLNKLEKQILKILEQFTAIVNQSASEFNPSVLAVYIYNLAKAFNSFYTEHSVLQAESKEKKELRLQICSVTASVIKEGMQLLGIQVPEKM